MSTYLRQNSYTPRSEIIPPNSEEKFVNNYGILIILILIIIIVITVIWLLGSKTGDTVTDGKILPYGFPLYLVRNVFSSLSLVLLGTGIYLVSRYNQDFNSAMLIFLFAVCCGCIMLFETYFQVKQDSNTACLILALSTTAILFMIFLSWGVSLWIKFFFFIPLFWFIYLLLEVLYYNSLNGSGAPII
jgi:hypothetical protein